MLVSKGNIVCRSTTFVVVVVERNIFFFLLVIIVVAVRMFQPSSLFP